MHTHKYNFSMQVFFARPSQRCSIPLVAMELPFEMGVNHMKKKPTGIVTLNFNTFRLWFWARAENLTKSSDCMVLYCKTNLKNCLPHREWNANVKMQNSEGRIGGKRLSNVFDTSCQLIFLYRLYYLVTNECNENRKITLKKSFLRHPFCFRASAIDLPVSEPSVLSCQYALGL